MMKKAFTLAEVLITLAIIGVVAGMSIPSLMNKINNKDKVVKLKKVYSTFSQALQRYQADNGVLEEVFVGDGSSAASLAALEALAPYLNISKNCGLSSGCWYTSELKFLGGTVNSVDAEASWVAHGKAILADGTLFLIADYPGICSTSNMGLNNICGLMYVDVNGVKGPNTKGRDVFLFQIIRTGIVPAGANGDGYSCDPNSSSNSDSNGCTAKVLQESEMNY